MSEKHRAAFAVAIAVVAALLSFAVVGCTSTHSSMVSSLATSTPVSSAVAKAKSQLNVCLQKTGTTALLSSSGRTEFIDCMKTLVPPASQEAFKTCMTTAVTSDKLWTSDGRTKFVNESLPNCMNAAGTATATATS
jgi:hypothetical protein